MRIIKKFYIHLLIFLAIGIVLSYGVKSFFNEQKLNYLQVQTNLLQTQYETQYKYLKIMSHDIYIMYQDNKQLMATFAQAEDVNSTQKTIIRSKMYKMLKKRYRRLTNMGVKQLHFHLKDNTSFLRMHNPNKFGDNLAEYRYSVASTNKMQKPHEGFEVGKLAHGFRYVYPLYNDNKHIGSMEVSFSSNQLIKYITDKYVVDKHLLVLKSEILNNMWNESINHSYKDSLENPNYLVEKGSYSKLNNEEFFRVIKNTQTDKNIEKSMHEGKAFSISSAYNYNALSVTFIPIMKQTEDKNIAYLVIYTESDYLDTLLVEYFYVNVLLVSLLILLFIFSIYVTITQNRLEQMAHYDKLTLLPNRAYFYIELQQEIKRAKRFGYSASLMFVDLDGFKGVNDTFGHNAGDEILIQTARRLENSIRNVDIAARIGGDEFIVLLINVKSELDSVQVAKKIIKNLNKDFLVSKQVINIGASIGIATFPQDGEDIDSIVSNADEAMYKAKESGKNSFVVYQNYTK